MEKDAAPHNGTLESENVALKQALLNSVALLEDCRKFSAVARLSSTSNQELTQALLTFLIARLDPVLNNIYTNVPDQAFVQPILQKLQNPRYYEDNIIDFIEIFDENGNLIKSSIDDQDKAE